MPGTISAPPRPILARLTRCIAGLIHVYSALCLNAVRYTQYHHNGTLHRGSYELYELQGAPEGSETRPNWWIFTWRFVQE